MSEVVIGSLYSVLSIASRDSCIGTESGNNYPDREAPVISVMPKITVDILGKLSYYSAHPDYRELARPIDSPRNRVRVVYRVGVLD